MLNAFQIFALGAAERVRSIPRILALICVIVVPALYPLFWVQAFWKPYASVNNLPIAFVNEDTGALGTTLQADLETDNTLLWSFVDRETADEGLRNKTYYAYFVVPSDFSENIAAMQTASIETYVDGKNNYLSTLLANQIGAKLESRLSQQIAQMTVGKLNESIAAFVANPVDNQQIDINPLASSGTGFAPYFSSLALWIGALLISMVAGKPIGGERWRDFGGVNAVIGRYLLYAVIGILQSALVVAVLATLGITMSSVLLTFVALAVCSLCCIAIVSMLISLFGRFGQILAMVVLLFQLTSSGGTFPIQLTGSSLFQALHPFVPFTYSVNSLRETISGVPINGGVVGQAFVVQLIVVLVVIAICAAVEVIKRNKQTRLSVAKA